MAAARLIGATAEWRRTTTGVLVVAVDGHGASGKSTIAAEVASATGAALLHTDDFFHWPAATASARRVPPLDCYYDWRRIRTEALEPLRAGRSAMFRAFDWEAGALARNPVTIEARSLVVLEGVFSAAPQLADLVDQSVLVATPERERLSRLRGRVSAQEWDEDWLAAERAYFSVIRPPGEFSLVVAGTAGLQP
jgi:uridine kinase